MYVGFDVLALAAILRTGNPGALVLGVYSIVVYHFIIGGYLSSADETADAQAKASVRKYV